MPFVGVCFHVFHYVNVDVSLDRQLLQFEISSICTGVPRLFSLKGWGLGLFFHQAPPPLVSYFFWSIGDETVCNLWRSMTRKIQTLFYVCPNKFYGSTTRDVFWFCNNFQTARYDLLQETNKRHDHRVHVGGCEATSLKHYCRFSRSE